MGSFIPDPYKALNLPHSATLAQIKQAYRQLAKKYHPDTWSQPCFSETDRQEATAKFTAISNANELLTDERQKADYDRTYNLGGYREEEDRAPPAATSRNTTSTNTGTANNTGTGRTYTPNNTGPNNHNPPRPPPPPPCPPPPVASAITTGWASAIDPRTRRTYYYNKVTGERSWSLTPTNKQQPNHVSDSDYHRMFGNPQQQQQSDGRNTNKHACQCESWTALFLCPPLGIIAVYHSIMADRCWKRGEYFESRKHARLAPQYACWAICLGICFWLYWFLVRGNEDMWDGDGFDWNDLWGDNGP